MVVIFQRENGLYWIWKKRRGGVAASVSLGAAPPPLCLIFAFSFFLFEFCYLNNLFLLLLFFWDKKIIKYIYVLQKINSIYSLG